MHTNRLITTTVKARGAVAVLMAATMLLSGAAQAKDLVFGYVPAAMQYPYNVATAQGFEEAAKAAGVKTVVLDPQGSIEKQGNALDDLLTQKVDAIGFLPLDSVVAESYVDKVNAAGIPVVAIALQVGDSTKRELKDPYPGLSALVATDNYTAGYVSGEMAAPLLPKDRSAKIAIVQGDPAYTIVKLDTQGFRDQLDPGTGRIRVPELPDRYARYRPDLQPGR